MRLEYLKIRKLSFSFCCAEGKKPRGVMTSPLSPVSPFPMSWALEMWSLSPKSLMWELGHFCKPWVLQGPHLETGSLSLIPSGWARVEG